MSAVRYASLFLTSVIIFGVPSLRADDLRAVTVPYLLSLTGQHEVLQGSETILQGAALVPEARTLTRAEWDPGDGSAILPASSTADPRVLEASHVYALGPDGKETPWVAMLTVEDSSGARTSATFRILVVPQSAPARRRLDVERNMAIDRGLWYLHKQMELSTSGGVPTGIWRKACDYCSPTSGLQASGQRAAATASAVLAFEVNGHYETGDVNEDPYVDDVTRGLAQIMTEIETVIIKITTPEGAATTIIVLSAPVGGFEDAHYRPIYVTGQIVDAIVATRTPDKTAQTGEVIHWPYSLIVQDMIDMYAWGQVDAGTQRGGWRYLWNSDADNSASQWAAIAVLAVERSPFFREAVVHTHPRMKDEALLYWIPRSQYFDGYETSDMYGAFGYQGKDFSTTWPCGKRQNLTASGLLQLVFTGKISSSHPRFVAGQRYLADTWTDFLGGCPRIYGMYAAMKALTFVLEDPEHPENLQPPFTTLTGRTRTFDWFWSEVAAGDPVNGLARYLVNLQQASGRWDEAKWGVDSPLISNHLATAWAVTILSHGIIQRPVAVCSVEPEVSEGEVLSLDGSSSFHMDPARRIIRYEWDLDENGDFETTSESWSISHTFTGLGFHDVCLRVVDDSTPPLTSLPDRCRIEVVPPPRPPNSDPGGPYCFCAGIHKLYLLDGSRSSVSPDRLEKEPDVARIVSFLWDLEPPFDQYVEHGSWFDATEAFLSRGPGKYDISLKVVDDLGHEDIDNTTVTIVSGIQDCVCECRQRIGVQLPGDANQDGQIDIADAIWFLGHLFLGEDSKLPCEGSTADNPGSGDLALLDWNGDHQLSKAIDISDPINILNYLFLGTSGEHILGRGCIAIPGCPDNRGCQGNIPPCER